MQFDIQSKETSLHMWILSHGVTQLVVRLSDLISVWLILIIIIASSHLSCHIEFQGIAVSEKVSRFIIINSSMPVEMFIKEVNIRNICVIYVSSHPNALKEEDLHNQSAQDELINYYVTSGDLEKWIT